MFDDLKEKFLSLGSKGEKNKGNNEKSKDGKGGIANTMSNLLILLLVGVLLVIVGSMFDSPKGSSNKNNGALAVAGDNTAVASQGEEELYSAVSAGYKTELEEELVLILEQIDGVGKVNAVINFENGVERIPVFNENISTSETSEIDTNGGERNITQEDGGSNVVMESNEGNQKPFIIKENNPTISGVVIVAEGADDRTTELRIMQAAVKLFGLEDGKVVVYPMKK